MTDDTTDPAATPAPAPRDRSQTLLPLIGALVVALVFGAIIFFVGAGDDNNVGSETDADGALVCPRSYTRTTDGNDRVPADPAGVAGKAGLVPDAAPSHVSICRYGPPDGVAKPNEQIPYRDRTVLTAGLAAATRELSGARKATGTPTCSEANPDDAAFLIGFTFATGVLWVSVPGEACVRTSNGQFSTTTDYRASIEAAFRTKAWPAS